MYYIPNFLFLLDTFYLYPPTTKFWFRHCINLISISLLFVLAANGHFGLLAKLGHTNYVIHSLKILLDFEILGRKSFFISRKLIS